MSTAAAREYEADRASTKAAARVAEFFERHGRMVYGICRAMLRDVHEAEDAMQQTFLSAHRALMTGARVRDSGAWLATIARNECRGRIAAGMRTPLPVSDDDLHDVPHGVDDAERRLQAGALRDALTQLPERQREAVVLRYVYGLRYGEVAHALGLSRPATEALLFRARRAMRVRLRHAAGAALVVPLSVREELALALPGFEAHAGSGAAAAGVAGGLLAKLASAPTAAKIATATVAVSTVGAVGTAESDRPVGGARDQVRLVGERPSATSSRALPRSDDAQGDETRSGSGDERDGTGERGGTSGSRHGNDDRSDSSAREAGGEERSRASDDDELHDGTTGERDDTRGTGSGREEAGDDDSGGSSGSAEGSAPGELAEPSASSGSGSSGSGGDDGSDDASDDGSDGETSGSSGSGSGSSGSSDGSGDGKDGLSESGSGSGSGEDGAIEEP